LDIFDSKIVTPMLVGKNQQAFDSPDYIYELKLDGIRCLAYLWENGLELQNKRNKKLNSIYPELKDIYKQAKVRCLLDGELLILKDGKPDFFEVQRRSLMANPVKIEIASKKLPVCFIAYDILYLKDKQIIDLPLMERKKLLPENITESDHITISRYIETEGVALYNAAQNQGLEGVMAKRKDSKYYFGKKTKSWIKMKALLDEDFIVCGYYFKESSVVNVILGSFLRERMIYQSHVSMGISREDYRIMTSAEETTRSYYSNFPNFENAIWLKPKLVCCVQFMERTPNGGLRQPVFKGLRDDKLPNECIVMAY